ncbi:hypothetical protein F5X68DRAFT_71174 [Plectosphaerella plurivora]|uniref:Uncharacterized protein n=1 Tax=Plectosphaerella plurivora TaxID=936078 RepID=A0A9P9AEY2_9PEZI|nr:hypothetical protein F5X68DRAFT_71174 [Plectosphaerella plurivora]
MVVIVDFDEEELDRFHGHEARHILDLKAPQPPSGDAVFQPTERRFFQSIVTEAFAQYPVIESLVRHIDLNTLDSLARTSHLIHQALVQCKGSLIKATLHCVNSEEPVDRDYTLRNRARAGVHDFNWEGTPLRSSNSYLPYNGKSGKCALDLVSECRKCGVPVCRNCTTKQPASTALNDRYRRICTTCVEAPLVSLLDTVLEPNTPFESDEVQRELCQCDQRAGVWLCQPCGRSIRASDSDYIRIWRWRNHYGEVLGGLGTGIGDGDRGVICGREEACLAAKEREQETDCDAEDAREPLLTPGSSDGYASSSDSPRPLAHRQSSSSLHLGEHRTPSPLQLGPGYERHEIEGIGGVVKKKLVRMVRVGACVPEWEEDRSRSGIMRREREHQVRTLCGWCYRVVPSAADKAASQK